MRQSRFSPVAVLLAVTVAGAVHRIAHIVVWYFLGVDSELNQLYNDPLSNLVVSLSSLPCQVRVTGLFAGPLANLLVAFLCDVLFLHYGWSFYWSNVKGFFLLVWTLIRHNTEGKRQLRENIEMCEYSNFFRSTLRMLWWFSLIVAALELLPIPPFDGWHLLTRPLLELVLPEYIVVVLQLYGGTLAWIAVAWHVVPVIVDLTEQSLKR